MDGETDYDLGERKHLMKRKNLALLFILLVAVMGVFSLFGKASVTASAETAAEQQAEVPAESAADTGEVEYEGWAEAPWIMKYILFSVIGVIVLAIIASIYCAVTPMKRKKFH